MAVFKNFENKEDIFELIDKFEKSSLFELEISVAYPVEREISIKMIKTTGGVRSETKVFNEAEEIFGEFEENDNGGKETIKMRRPQNSTDSKYMSHAAEGNSGNIIKSPLIGKFYASPSPDSEPYVKIGDKVAKGAILCIIEAMKVMNEIESENDGEISEIYVKSGDTVEYGQPLFEIKIR